MTGHRGGMDDDTRARIEDAWLEAGDVLGIDVETPYVRESSAGTATFVAFLPDFGGPTGLVLGVRGGDDGDLPARVAEDEELVYAEVGDSFADFDEDLFRDALNEWGWSGPKDGAPDWYAGYTE